MMLGAAKLSVAQLGEAIQLGALGAAPISCGTNVVRLPSGSSTITTTAT